MLHQFWFPCLVLSIQTISNWWNDLAAILHNTSSKVNPFLGRFMKCSYNGITLVFQVAGSGQHPVPHRKAKTMKVTVIMQVGTHKECRATEKQT